MAFVLLSRLPSRWWWGLSSFEIRPYYDPWAISEQVDRPGVNVDKALDKISRELLQHEVVTEPYGGQTPILPVRNIVMIYSDREYGWVNTTGRLELKVAVCNVNVG